MWLLVWMWLWNGGDSTISLELHVSFYVPFAVASGTQQLRRVGQNESRCSNGQNDGVRSVLLACYFPLLLGS